MQTATQAPNPAPSKAIEAAARVHAEAAAQNPQKLRKAMRVVKAALDLGVIDLDDLHADELPPAA